MQHLDQPVLKNWITTQHDDFELLVFAMSADDIDQILRLLHRLASNLDDDITDLNSGITGCTIRTNLTDRTPEGPG